jgi:peroxiredoxin
VPKLKKIHDDYKDKDVVILGIHTKSASEKMPAFVEKEEIKYAVCVDDKEEMEKKYDVNGWPTYFVIDKKGIVRSIGHSAPTHQQLDELLKEDGPKK